jgi:valyl-tRNA synthetase
VEASKLSTRGGDDAEKDRASTVLLDVLVKSLALMHPVIPFVTEEIYSKLAGHLPAANLARPAHPSFGDPGLSGAAAYLMASAYPEPDDARRVPEIDARFESLKEMVRAVRALRGEFSIAPESRLKLSLRFEPGFGPAAFIRDRKALAASLMNAAEFEECAGKPEGCVALVCKGMELYVHVKEAVDPGALADKFEKEIARERQYMEKTSAKLSNQAFVNSAPADIVAKEREKLAEADRRVGKLSEYVRELRG